MSSKKIRLDQYRPTYYPLFLLEKSAVLDVNYQSSKLAVDAQFLPLWGNLVFWVDIVLETIVRRKEEIPDPRQ